LNVDTYTTTLAIGPLCLSLETADAGLYAAQQRAYHAFVMPLQPSLRGAPPPGVPSGPATKQSQSETEAEPSFVVSESAASLLTCHLHFAFTAGAAPATWPFEFQAGRLHFAADYYTGTIDLAQQQGQLTFTSLHPFEAADYFVRTALALLAFEAGGLLFHAAGLAYHDRGYAFFGYSGSGKTTVARLSPHARLLNDDLVVLLPQAAGWNMHATPFSNPTQVQPAGRQRVPLTALYRLVQDRRVFLEALDPAVAIAEVVASSPIVCADPDRAFALLDRAAQLTRAVPVQRLHFLPDASFWDVIDPL
jgi:hypothetical protein